MTANGPKLEIEMAKISSEEVNSFLEGRDPMEGIITIEADYQSQDVLIVYKDKDGNKHAKKDAFMPFVWAKHSAAIRLYDGNRNVIKKKLNEYGIRVKALKTSNGGEPLDRLENGYKYLFYAFKRMTYSKFMMFFSEGGVPIYESKKNQSSIADSSKEYLAVSPVEQYMMKTGKRLFKGYDNYNDLTRLTFDLETQGLNPRIHRIDQIGIHTNKGYDKILTVNKDGSNELEQIEESLKIMSELQPDIIVGHNSENFDWDFFIVRLQMHGTSIEDVSSKYFTRPIYKKKKESVLKLGGEVEYYFPTIIYGHVVLDSLHAARRAQAIDSNMKSSNLKYLTKYLDLVKQNRVYVPGDKITSTWNDTSESFAFNDTDGTWYKLDDSHPLKDGYVPTSGKYIVERYLLDDLWETDKVEEKLNESNFLVAKLLPTTFTKVCTMGTAGIWKLIMLAWSFEHDLAIPAFGESKRFTGGLSRLLKTGYVENIVKLDYNSLYPSIILTWNIATKIDITGVMTSLLEYILTQREKYKGLKGDAGDMAKKLAKQLDQCEDPEERERLKKEIKHWKIEKNANDKKQLPLKILANSFFGSYGAPNIFPFGDNICAEMTTCTGRQMLRLMISHFKSIGYEPIVGDSFTADTPVFVKYDNSGYIDIRPICELVGKTETDALGREYDTEDKPYKVLCRSGWMKPNYIYRHKTDKPVYKVEDGNMQIEVTEDHSLFNSGKEKIKPSEITENTQLEYFTDFNAITPKDEIKCDGYYAAEKLINGKIDRVPLAVLNGNREALMGLIEGLDGFDISKLSKTARAGILYCENRLKAITKDTL